MAYQCVHAITETQQAVCGFFEGKQSEEWPNNHFYDLSRDHVNCAECLEILEARERAKANRNALRGKIFIKPPAGDPCW
jgi:hypothetical protein